LDPKRAQAFIKPTVHKHFNLLLEIICKYEILVKNIYNMDEKGCQRGGGPTCFLDLSFLGKNLHENGLRLTVTLVELNGPFTPLRKLIKLYLRVSTSENGWTDNFLCKEWFKNSFTVFPRQLHEMNLASPFFLSTYDGHSSHEKLKPINLTCTHNIILFCLPPHTTHKLQPLDVGVFGPLQCAWSE